MSDTNQFEGMLLPDDLSAEQAAPREDHPVPCERLIGAAGTGKTYQLLQRTKDDPEYGLLTATTGISAVNLGAITIHSTLRYSDTASLRDAFLSGRLARTLHAIARSHRRLIVEEYSMADGEQLDLWYRGVEEANRYADVSEPLGILLVGDLAQLPPVKAKWVFEADCWEKFAQNTVRLDKVWRQAGGPFLDALNHTREGRGGLAAEILAAAGARFETQLDPNFEGTTILPKNQNVNRYNAMALDRVPGERFHLTARRWGRQRSEWSENPRTHEWGIPPRLELKLDAYVMILANAPDFSYVNGDCGHVRDFDEHGIDVELVRTGKVMRIDKIVRGMEMAEEPDGWMGERIAPVMDAGEYIPRQHYRAKMRRYVLGQVEYLPVRLAYASTVHKSQSLTLDRVQVDYRDPFFGHPAMLYVALSRCRTLEGLRMVGSRERFAAQCKMEAKVREWL